MDGEQEETVILLWNFPQFLDYGKDIKLCIHPISQKFDVIWFTVELKAKFYDYCTMSKATATFDHVL